MCNELLKRWQDHFLDRDEFLAVGSAVTLPLSSHPVDLPLNPSSALLFGHGAKRMLKIVPASMMLETERDTAKVVSPLPKPSLA